MGMIQQHDCGLLLLHTAVADVIVSHMQKQHYAAHATAKCMSIVHSNSNNSNSSIV